MVGLTVNSIVWNNFFSHLYQFSGHKNVNGLSFWAFLISQVTLFCLLYSGYLSFLFGVCLLLAFSESMNICHSFLELLGGGMLMSKAVVRTVNAGAWHKHAVLFVTYVTTLHWCFSYIHIQSSWTRFLISVDTFFWLLLCRWWLHYVGLSDLVYLRSFWTHGPLSICH